MSFNRWMFSVWALMCLEISNVLSREQYHVQTDEGPDKMYRFQTDNGQYNKQTVLEDGTIFGTNAWIDANNCLRITKYLADNNVGYHIMKSLVVYLVDPSINTEDAIVAAMKNPTQQDSLSIEKCGLAQPPSKTARTHFSTVNRQRGTRPTYLTTTTEKPILGYISPEEAAQLQPTTYLGYDHYPNELQRPIYVASGEETQQIGNNDEFKKSPNGYAISKPSKEGYYYDKPSQALPHEVNALKDELLPPLAPSYGYRRVSPTQQTFKKGGIIYLLPKQYHEEEEFSDNKKAGSHGYVDPFGIRRVVYYNTSPEKGFIHRNHNTYVGTSGNPYDEPKTA